MRTLLLADDNVTVQRVIALTFAQEPVRVVTASDGHQAMDRVVVERPDIVLAGTTLPQVNGYELARFVRSKAELKNVPVLLLSGAFETVDEALLKSSGASGVIEKPVEPIAVISRVKELLGLKSDGAAPSSGRLVTPAVPMPEPPAPVAPQVAAPAQPPPAAGDPLESAYDTLDRQMAGQVPAAQRNPAPPLTKLASPGDPRSPGKPPAAVAPGDAGNPVYEVDDAWFSDTSTRETTRDEGGRDVAEDLGSLELQAPGTKPDATPVYEVDDEWFAEDQKAREARELEQKQLAAEMGIHEVPLPAAPPAVLLQEDEPEPVSPREPLEELPPEKPVEPLRPIETPSAAGAVPELRLDEPVFAQDFRRAETAPAPEELQRDESAAASEELRWDESVAAPEEVRRNEPEETEFEETEFEPVPRTLPIDWFARSERSVQPPSAPIEVRPVAPIPIAEFDDRPAPTAPGRVADDFAQLLAFEQGEHSKPPMIEPVIHAVTPEITAEMLDQIASTVADRLRGSVRVEPKAPEITGEMLKTIAYLVSAEVRNHIRIEPVAPAITPEMINQISEKVATPLRDAIRVEPKAPELSEGMLQFIARNVADRLRDSIRVEPAIPELNASMLDQLAGTVTARLTGTVEGSVSAATQALMAGLKDSIAASIRDTVRTVVAETSERLVREEIERIKSKAQ